MIKIWKNTTTLDAWVPEILEVADLREAELAVIGGKPIDLDSMPQLQGLFKCGIGRDNVPFAECKARGIEVCFPSQETCSVIYEETANFAVHLILRMLYADVGSLDNWTKRPRRALESQQVLLVGVGNIGQRVKRKLHGLVGVKTFDILENEPCELPGLLRDAEGVSLHLPLKDETRHFMDAEKLSWMRDGAVLVNTARGALVEEVALLKEIQSGRLRAAFDVFWQEPYAGPLREHHPERFYITPHVASTCENFLSGLAGDLNEFIACMENPERED